jgi:signal transduction histidine kinase
VLAIVATAALSWVSYRTVRAGLQEEFARRLQSLAAAGASQVGPGEVEDARQYGEEGGAYISIQVLLEQLRATPGTVNASLIDSARAVVYDCRGALQGQTSALDTLGGPALANALAGEPAVTPPYRWGSRLLQAGLAPVRTEHGTVVAALAVEAEPRYSALLDRFRRTLLLTAGIITLVIVVFVAVRVRLARRELELERQLSRAENLAAMGRLTATLAHEIKNPLAIIRGSAQRLGKLEPEAQRMAEFVVEETDRLGATVARYLQFARGDRGATGAGDALAALAATLALLEGEFRARRVTLRREGLLADAGPPGAQVLTVGLDNESLKQVYLNLLLNALDALPEGGTLRAAVGERRGRIEVTIEDDGSGIAAETLRQLGSPFFTTKAQGTGLGLFLTRRLVQSAGGALEIESQPGRGTTCVVRLPRRRG